MDDAALEPTLRASASPDSKAPHRELELGTRIGRFDLESVLGSGGMGVVYAARDSSLGRTVAIKVVRGHEQSDVARVRLLEEARAMAKISHPGVVPVFDVGELPGGDIYVAMEHMPGGTLAAWLAAQPRSWRETVAVLLAAGEGLAAAHAAGIVHRDFKPENVLLGADGRPRVSDFGLARTEERAIPAPDGEDSHRTNTIAGTPAYMAPEQHLGRAVDAKSDQFAFCVALWEALYGERPFRPQAIRDAKTAAALAAAVIGGRIVEPSRTSRVPRRIEVVLRRGLAVDPAVRWPNMEALLDALRAATRADRLRRWGGAMVALGIISLIIVTRLLRSSSIDAPCPLPAVTGWNEAVRNELATRLAGHAHAAEDLASFDAFASRWSAEREAVCGRRIEALSQTQVACLDDALRRFEAMLDSLPKVWDAWPEIPSLLGCTEHPGMRAPQVKSLEAQAEPGARYVLSPDAASIASASRGQLRITTLAGTTLWTAAVPPRTAVLSWPSPRRIIYTTMHAPFARPTVAERVVEVDPISGAPKVIPLPEHTISVSPDASRALVAAGTKLSLVTIDGRLVREIGDLREEELEPRSTWSWSPDQRRVAFVVIAASERALLVIDLERATIWRAAFRADTSITGERGVEWLDDHRLVVSGRPDRERGESLWTVRVGTSVLDEPVELRLAAPPTTFYHLESSAGGLVLATQGHADREIVRLRDGVVTTVDASVQAFRMRGITSDRTRLLVERERDAGLLAIDSHAYTPLAREGEAIAVRGDRVLVWDSKTVYEVDATADRHRIAELPASAIQSKPKLRCATATPQVCIGVWNTDTDAEYRVLRGASWAPPAKLVLGHWVDDVALSPDGNQLALTGGPTVEVIDVATGRVDRWPLPGSDECVAKSQFAAWSGDGKSLYATQWCTRNNARLLRLERARPPVVVHESKAWISSIVVTDAHDLYLNLKQFTSVTVLVEGL